MRGSAWQRAVELLTAALECDRSDGSLFVRRSTGAHA
jgi:hypothetical protein